MQSQVAQPHTSFEVPRLFLGCPVWACDHWKGSLYTANAARHDWLRQYSSVFSTVEGNSTFYALPTLETAKRWGQSVCPGFQFSLKVPRVISHELRLADCQQELSRFLAVANVLRDANCLGPSFLQLPPDFSGKYRDRLARFLDTLPPDLPWSVEVRHLDWFDEAEHELWLDEQLKSRCMDRVLFDSRPLYSSPPEDEIEKVSQTRKPKSPLRHTVTGQHPLVRLVGRNRLDTIEPWIQEWAPVVAGWLRQRLEPFFFTHAPDDAFAPEFGRRMHAAIRKLIPELAPLPPWPGEQVVKEDQQLYLF